MADTPQHVAIIMDGNGRWARSRGLPRRPAIAPASRWCAGSSRNAPRRNVRYLTLFAFSSENWRRPPDEVGMLMSLFLDALVREVANLHRNQVRLRFIGDRDLLGAELAQRMADAESLTEANTGLGAVRGGGLRRPLGHRAGLPLARGRCRRRHAGAVSDIGEAQVGARLALAGIPDPDLLIRTGGEQRISNFLLWNLAYTEIYFTEVLWPEFTPGASRGGIALLRPARTALRQDFRAARGQSRCLGFASRPRRRFELPAAGGAVLAAAALDRARIWRRCSPSAPGSGPASAPWLARRRAWPTRARWRCCSSGAGAGRAIPRTCSCF